MFLHEGSLIWYVFFFFEKKSHLRFLYEGFLFSGEIRNVAHGLFRKNHGCSESGALHLWRLLELAFWDLPSWVNWRNPTGKMSRFARLKNMENSEFFCAPIFFGRYMRKNIVLVDRWFRKGTKTSTTKITSTTTPIEKGKVFFQTIPNLWGHVTISAYGMMPTKPSLPYPSNKLSKQNIYEISTKRLETQLIPDWSFHFFLTQIYLWALSIETQACVQKQREISTLCTSHGNLGHAA